MNISANLIPSLFVAKAKASKATDAVLPADGANDLYRACECGAAKCKKAMFMRPKDDIDDQDDYTDSEDENDA